MTDLTHRSTHFDFGENWASFSNIIDEARTQDAERSVAALVGALAGRSFLDIGCGSGLFSLAALRLGADRVVAIDIDEHSTWATTALLAQSGERKWQVREQSIFDFGDETFDIVYSWGVLHHTGDMWRAIERASSAVRPGGTFAFALYEKTRFCPIWRLEKRLYRRAPALVQGLVRMGYETMQVAARIAAGRDPFLRRQNLRRGMDYAHDVHDWLGGYPYESTTLAEVEQVMRRLGFELVSHLAARLKARGVGGSACSEYVYRRVSGREMHSISARA